MAQDVLREGVEQLERVEGRSGADTIRLWEGFREQAVLWRALALLQIPTTALAILAALIMFKYSDTIIEVPPQPQPGIYSVKELPDSAFINVSQEVVNLIATFQPDRVELQYGMARKYLWEPALTAVQQYMKETIPQIKQTRKSQIFMINPSLTRVERKDDRQEVVVSLRGVLHKLIGSQGLSNREKGLAPEDRVYEISMTTIPRNEANEYGIVVRGIKVLTPTATEEE